MSLGLWPDLSQWKNSVAAHVGGGGSGTGSAPRKIHPEVVAGCLHAPVPGRRRAKARGSDGEAELEGKLSALRPGREPLRPRGWPGRHHAAPAERCRGPGHRRHPRSDLWYVSTQPRLRPASAAPASVLHLRRPEICLLWPLATSSRTCGAVSCLFAPCYAEILPQSGRKEGGGL